MAGKLLEYLDFLNVAIHTNYAQLFHPMAFTHSSFLDRNSMTIVLATIFLIGSYVLDVLTPAWGLALSIGAVANEIHCFTHLQTKKVPRTIRILQKLRILQTQKHHVAGHHGTPFDDHYCVITNIMNPILDNLMFWRFLEFIVYLLTGVSPRR
ncbi:Kua-ubiquitin conjugating enzyme hybrid localization domain protein [Gimesia maris]|uniref:fatty acid desaturase CarF family protein n=1 Tax=Gimesia maris TaxID=122 RepID=UPI0011891C0A|nr:Kua-ubiquitin conjugating enzyme hybrid localization domain protein [Gimesia maris]